MLAEKEAHAAKQAVRWRRYRIYSLISVNPDLLRTVQSYSYNQAYFAAARITCPSRDEDPNARKAGALFAQSTHFSVYISH